MVYAFNQGESLNYDKTYKFMVHHEFISIAFNGFLFYHVDVKSTFLNGSITKEVYVEPLSLEHFDFSNNVFELKMAIWFETCP